MSIKTKLPKKFKTKWVNALLSGEFNQGMYRLASSIKTRATKKNTTFCCLGVAEYICGTKIKDMRGKGLPEYLKEKSNIPILLRQANNSKRRELIRMNDDGKSFKQIAAYIKRYL